MAPEFTVFASLADAFFMPESQCIKGVRTDSDRSKLAYL